MSARQTPLDATAFANELTRLHSTPHYALAVSGGRDSLAMVALAAQNSSLKFSVLSVDHKLRPEAAGECEQVAEICAVNNLPHYILSADTPLPKSGLQQAARELRYRLMGQWCVANNAGALVVAHHLGDQAETILMRLAHHSGIAGLAGMSACQNLIGAGGVKLLRPFLQTPREELESVLVAAKIKYSDDPSNADPQYERVRWRNKLAQLEAVGLSPARLAAFAATCATATRELDAQCVGWLEQHAIISPYNFFELDRPAFAASPPEQQKRIVQVLVQWLGDNPYPASPATIDRALAAMETEASGAATFGGCHLRWQSRHLRIGREAAAITTPHLGATGAQRLREQGTTLPDIPAAYLHALPTDFAFTNPPPTPTINFPDMFKT